MKIPLTEPLLRKEYLENDLSQYQIALKYDYTRSTVGKYLRSYNIVKSHQAISATIRRNMQRQPSREHAERDIALRLAAATMGRLGGLIGGRVRAKKLSPQRRSEIARKAANARWHK